MKILFASFLLILAFQVSFGQEKPEVQPIDVVKYFDDSKRWYNNFTEHWFYFSDISETDVRNSIIHWEQIAKDFNNPSNDWSGTYGDGGETHGDYLRWSKENGFVWLKVNKCQGGPMQIIRGKVAVDSSKLILYPEINLGRNHHGNHKSHNKQPDKYDFLLVKWGNSSYLISPKNISSFADYTAGLGEYNNPFQWELGYGFLYRFDKENSENTGELPIFPKGYEKFVKKPIKTEINNIGKGYRQHVKDSNDSDKFIIPIKLNVGKNQGVYRNLSLLFVGEEPSLFEEIRIKQVFQNFSVAHITRTIPKKNCQKTEFTDCEGIEYTQLKVGMKLSTTGR